MGTISLPAPALGIVAAISRYEAALDWAQRQIATCWGAIELISERFDFTETAYYESEMGSGLKKQFLVLGELIDPASLAERKLQTNGWEAAYVTVGRHAEPRPLNLDPGYLTQAKLVLASTKDHAHRIYLRSGIYAEVTLRFRGGSWEAWPWTYPDYRRADYHAFFSEARELLRRRLRERQA
ncbi:MAG: DUF4416 family protein [Pirellulales bacterium]|jgi:hypothetical protein|nr:DUF4416 family protein [Pirellulales bacterium]